MRKVLLVLSVALVPALAPADELYRWKDERGVVHYTNIARNAPAEAVVVVPGFPTATRGARGLRRSEGARHHP